MGKFQHYSITPLLHYSNRNALDGAPHCFMLRRFRLAESRRGKGSCERIRSDG